MKRQLLMAHTSLFIAVAFAACKPSHVRAAVSLHRILGSGASGPGEIGDFNPNCAIAKSWPQVPLNAAAPRRICRSHTDPRSSTKRPIARLPEASVDGSHNASPIHSRSYAPSPTSRSGPLPARNVASWINGPPITVDQRGKIRIW